MVVWAKDHIKRAKSTARVFKHRYTMLIIKWDNARTFVSGNTKTELTKFAKHPLKAVDYKSTKILKVR